MDLDRKDADIESIAEKARKDEEVLSDVVKGVLSSTEVLRFNSFKVLLLVSEENPELLYPYWDTFVAMLTSDNAYQRHIAVYLIADLTRKDAECKFEDIFDTYYALLDDKSVIPAAHLALNSGKIAKAKPHLQTEITNKLLSIDKTHHKPDRKDLIKGYAIEGFDEYFAEAADKEKILSFVTEQLESKSPTTKKKAKTFLKKWKD